MISDFCDFVIFVHPQYKQDAELIGTPIPKANYNQSPVQIYSGAGRDDTIWRGLFINFTTLTINNTTQIHDVFIPYTVKYTVRFSGRRWLPSVPTADYRHFSGHLLGPNVLGSGPHTGTDDHRLIDYGKSGSICVGQSEPHVQAQSRTAQTLVNKDESTDSKDAIPFGPKTDVLDTARNRYWKGHTPGGPKKVSSVHQRERPKHYRERSTVPYELPRKKQEKQERGNHGNDHAEEKMLGDMYEISATAPECVQIGTIPTSENLQD